MTKVGGDLADMKQLDFHNLKIKPRKKYPGAPQIAASFCQSGKQILAFLYVHLVYVFGIK